MIATIVTIMVKPENVDAFIEATLKNHEATRKEPANIRFDFIRSKTDPNHFTLYEVFESAAGIDEHKKTEHYNVWRETVEPWMSRKRQGLPCDVIAPLDREAW